jgi:hypothetical protein
MSLNDFDNIPDPDDRIISKVGSAVQAAMAAKEVLHNSLAEAIDSSTTFGYELAVEDTKVKIIDILRAELASVSSIEDLKLVTGLNRAIELISKDL